MKRPPARRKKPPPPSIEAQAALEALQKAAEALREAQQAYEEARQAEAAVAAERSRGADLKELYQQGLAFVRKHPGVGVSGAVALGFLIGRSLRR